MGDDGQPVMGDDGNPIVYRREIGYDDAEFQVPDVSLRKLINGEADDAITVNVGELVTYTIKVTNDSPFAISNYRVIDDMTHLSDYLHIYANTVQVNRPNVTAVITGDVLTANIQQLPAGETVTITFNARVLVPAAGSFHINTATLYFIDETGGREVVDRDTATFQVPELEIEKLVNGGDSVLAYVGDTLTYTITVRNVSEFDAANYQVIDDMMRLSNYLSVNVASIAVSNANASATFINGVLTANIHQLLAGEAVTITFTATVLEAAVNASHRNVATLYGPPILGERPVIDDDDAIVRVPDVSIEKLVNGVDLTFAHVGDTLTYTITVTNHSPFNVLGYQVTDDLTHLLDYISVNANSITVTSRYDATYEFVDGVLTVTFPELGGNEVATITFTATVLEAAAGETFVNTAVLTGPGGEREDDSTTYVPDLSIEKLVNDEDNITAEVGDELTYTITVTNHSAFTVSNYQVIDNLSHLLNFIAINTDSLTVESNHPATYAFNNGVLIVTFSELDEDEVVMITFTATVLPAAAGRVLENIATLYGPPGDGGDRPPVDDDDADVEVPRALQPSIEKSADVTTQVVGGEIEYTLTVNNRNDFDLEDFLVVDNLNTSLVSFVPGSVQVNGVDAPYTFVNGQLRVYLPVLAPGETVITFRVVVLPAAAGREIPNVADLYGPPGDDGERPPIDDDDEIVRIPSVTLDKQVNGEDSIVARVGDTLTYTITVTNHSTFYVLDYQVVDDLRHLLGFISINVDSITVESNHPAPYTFDNGVLTVTFSRLDAAEVATITFTAVVLEAASGETFRNNAILYGPPGEDGERPPVDDDYAEVEVEPGVPDPTEPTRPTEPLPTDPTEPPTAAPEPTEASTTCPDCPPEQVVPTQVSPRLPQTSAAVFSADVFGLGSIGVGATVGLVKRRVKAKGE